MRTYYPTTEIETEITKHLLAIRYLLQHNQPEGDYYLSMCIKEGAISFNNAYFEKETYYGNLASEAKIAVYLSERDADIFYRLNK